MGEERVGYNILMYGRKLTGTAFTVYKLYPALLITLLLIVFPVELAAQAITIIGGGGDARDCSMAAENAAKLGFVSRDDLDACTRAIDYGNLKRGDLAGTYVNRGIVETALAYYQDAFADYHHAMKVNPELPEAYVGRGNIYFLAEKYNEAVKDYTKALDLKISRDYIAHLNLGMAYEKLGRVTDAEANYQRALELQPGWKLAKDKLDRLLAKQKQGMENGK